VDYSLPEDTDSESDTDFLPYSVPSSPPPAPVNRLPHRPRQPSPPELVEVINRAQYQIAIGAKVSSDTMDSLVWTICLVLVRMPFRGKCGHVFCEGCLLGRGVVRCPMCREDWTKDRPLKDLILNKILKDLSK